MNDLKGIENKIQELRGELQKLIESKGSINDPEVIAASQMLDAVLNRYNEILMKKIK